MKRILVVDDSAVIRLVIKKALAGSDFEVVAEATNAADAIALCAAHTPDAVTLDLRLPGSDGLAVLQSIREKSPAAAIVVVSSLAHETLRGDAARLGARGFVPKPFKPEDLRRALGEATATAAPPPG